MSAFHDELVARLQYFEGHSDTLGLFADGFFLKRAAAAVADPFRGNSVQKVAGIEARGFVLAACVALELDAGFVAIRKPGSIHPGPKVELTAPSDWRGLETPLRLQHHVIDDGERILIVDDWPRRAARRSRRAGSSLRAAASTLDSRCSWINCPTLCGTSCNLWRPSR